MDRRLVAAALIFLAIITIIPAHPASAASSSISAEPGISQPVLTIWSSSASSGNITNPNLLPGTEFRIAVNITGAPNFDTYFFILEYNFRVLEVINASLSGTMFWGNTIDSTVATYVIGRVQVSVRGGSPASGNGPLLYVSFRVLTVSLSVLSITNAYLALSGTTVPHLDKSGCFNNRTPILPSISSSSNPAPGHDQTSEYMVGRVTVGIILPESEGSRYDWTDEEINDTISGIKSAMDWWTSQAPPGSLQFLYNIHIRVPTSYEPFQMPFGDPTWVADVLNRMGYTGDAYTAARDFDNQIRAENGSDWAFTIFVADSDPWDIGFAGTHGYAYALIGGPFLVMARYSTYAWAPSPYSIVVPAHETGHIFGATDEYNNYPEYSGYLWTPDADGSTGIMNSNFLRLSASSRAQVGLTDCDSDGRPDLQQVKPALFLDPPPTNITDQGAVVTGRAVVVPFPTYRPGGRSVTVGKIVKIDYNVDGGIAINATGTNGFFGHSVENFSIPIQGLSQGIHTVDARATDSYGNTGTTSFQVHVFHSATSGIAELIKWQARPAYRFLDLARSPEQDLRASVVARNSSAYVRVRFQITNDNGAVWAVETAVTRLGKDEQRIVDVQWIPPNLRAKYQVIATLYYSGLPLQSGRQGWVVGGVKSFSFQVFL